MAKDCVAFANAQGGFIYVGIENEDSLPPANQKIADKNLPETIQKNIVQISVQEQESYHKKQKIKFQKKYQNIVILIILKQKILLMESLKQDGIKDIIVIQVGN